MNYSTNIIIFLFVVRPMAKKKSGKISILKISAWT